MPTEPLPPYLGRASAAARRIMTPVLVIAALLSLGLWKFQPQGTLIWASALGFLTALFGAFVVYFFRDPEPNVPAGPGLVVAPGHGKVDVIDEIPNSDVVGGRAKRVSIFLSVFDVHVQQAPVSGVVTFVRHTPGQFLNAMRTDCSELNENVLIGFRASDPSGTLVGIRLIAGLIARRIVPFVSANETVARGGRISLIQFGSRVDVHLPVHAEVMVKLGDRVVGGETSLARIGKSS